MRWQDFISSDPAIAAGKPVIRGTRVSVEFLLRLLASGWTPADVRREYAHLPPEAVEAALLFAAEAVEHELVFPAPQPGAA